jgi:hypothetical protein
MKRIRNLAWNRMSRMLLGAALATTVIFLWGCGGYVSETYAEGNMAYASDDVQFLAQYGDWINVPPYGMVWQPSVVDGWEPFYYGHWDWTGDDWAWVSYEPYGWLVYHYGYWDYQPGYGWFWISGNEWSPARVDWITYGDYVGWAPMPPPGVTWPEPWMHHDVGVWNIVPVRDFDRDNIGQYRIVKPPRVSRMHRAMIEHHSPNIQRIEMETRRKISRVPIQRYSMNMTFRQPERRGSKGEMRKGQGEEQQRDQGQTARRIKRGRDQEPQRMVLPDSERKRVERHRSKVEREVLRRHPGNRGEQQRGRDREQGHERGGNHRR